MDRTEHILSLSYGKDSLACLGAIEQLSWPLDRIIHAEVWATDTIPADLPPMVEFKAKADEIIKRRWGIEVEHYAAEGRERERERESYESMFYQTLTSGKFVGSIRGFPMVRGAWCKKLKYGSKINLRERVLQNSHIGNSQGSNIRVPDDTGCLVQRPTENGGAIDFLNSPKRQGADKNIVVSYLGIAADEPERLARLDGKTKVSPLAALGWTEADCRKWCEDNDLLSPIYTTATRGGCWFCHNQSIEQLRLLRRNYPDLWGILLKWDSDSPVSFNPRGYTVHDYDLRFVLEEQGLVPCDRRFRWSMLNTYKEAV